MRNLLRRGIALAAFVVPSTMALTARAESAPLPVCQLLLAPTDEAIPANAPALVGRQTSQSNATIESTTVVSDPQWPGSFTVVDDTRSPLTKLFVPSQELPAGVELTIEHSLDCTSLTGTAKATFTPSASSPLPTTIGVAKGIAKVEPSADLVKFLPVTMFEAKYRDSVYPLASYGLIRLEADGSLPVPIGQVPTSVLCADDERSDKTVQVELRAHVAGATADPTPVTVDVAVTCRPRTGAPPSSSSSSPTDAGPDTETTVRDDAGGCAVVPSAPASVWATFAVGALAVVAARRRHVKARSDRRSSR